MKIRIEEINELINTQGKLVVLDFYAAWCAPCKTIAKVIDDVSEKYLETAIFVKIDVEEDGNNEIVRKFQIRALPTVYFFRDGKEINKIVSAGRESEFLKLLESMIG